MNQRKFLNSRLLDLIMLLKKESLRGQISGFWESSLRRCTGNAIAVERQQGSYLDRAMKSSKRGDGLKGRNSLTELSG